MIRPSTKKRIMPLNPHEMKPYYVDWNGTGIVHFMVTGHPYTLCGRRISKNGSTRTSGNVDCLYCFWAKQYVGLSFKGGE